MAEKICSLNEDTTGAAGQFFVVNTCPPGTPVRIDMATARTFTLTPNVGIGTASPGHLLHVVDSATAGNVGITAAAGAGLVVQDTSGTADARIAHLVVAGDVVTLRGLLETFATGAVGITLDLASGDVGIGTTSPAHRFHVVDEAAPTNIGVSGVGGGGVLLQDTGGTVDVRVAQITVSGDSLLVRGLTDAFGVGVAGIALDLATGNVGIGEASTGGALHVKGLTSSGVQTTTLGAAATTLAVTESFVELTGDAGANTLATITGGSAGVVVRILFKDALVTITDDATKTADTVNLSAAFTSTADDVLTLVHDGTSWYESARSVN